VSLKPYLAIIYQQHRNHIEKANNLYSLYYPYNFSDANEVEEFYWLVSQANGREIYNSIDVQRLWDEYRSTNPLY
jgi:hypothetical protein